MHFSKKLLTICFVALVGATHMALAAPALLNMVHISSEPSGLLTMKIRNTDASHFILQGNLKDNNFEVTSLNGDKLSKPLTLSWDENGHSYFGENELVSVRLRTDNPLTGKGFLRYHEFSLTPKDNAPSGKSQVTVTPGKPTAPPKPLRLTRASASASKIAQVTGENVAPEATAEKVETLASNVAPEATAEKVEPTGEGETTLNSADVATQTGTQTDQSDSRTNEQATKTNDTPAPKNKVQKSKLDKATIASLILSTGALATGAAALGVTLSNDDDKKSSSAEVSLN